MMTATRPGASSPVVDMERACGFGTMKWGSQPRGVIAMTVAEMDVITDPFVLDGLEAFIRRQGFGYPSTRDIDELSVATASWMERAYGWQVEPDRVRPVGDVLKAVEAAVAVFSPPEHELVLLTPCYSPFFEVGRFLGRRIHEVPLQICEGRYTLDLDRLRSALAGGRTLLLCNPGNPTGQVFRREELLELSSIVADTGARVVADEVHAPLVLDDVRHIPYASVSAATATHTVTITSASKGWNIAGMKCAQVITANDTDTAAWEKATFLYQHTVARIGIVANTLAYTSPTSWLADVRRELRIRRDALVAGVRESLPKVVLMPPQATYLAWLDLRGLRLADEPAEFLLQEARVALGAGDRYGTGYAHFSRLNFATSCEALTTAISRMADALTRSRTL